MDASTHNNYAIGLEPNGLNHVRHLFPTNRPSQNIYILYIHTYMYVYVCICVYVYIYMFIYIYTYLK